MSKDARHLSEWLPHAAATWPDGVAVEDQQGALLTYAELNRQADRLATRLSRWGVGRGDRVGLMLPKSREAVVAIHAIHRTGAAYVPVDPTSPARRGAGILADAHVRAAVVAAPLAAGLRASWTGPGMTPRLVLTGDGPEPGFGEVRLADILADTAPSPPFPARLASDPAYVLYTSGSTGQPKGVVLSHASALSFLDWCAGTFALAPRDRFASHAPFHFDLSVFDLFAACRVGGTVVLIGESLGRDAVRLGNFLAERRIDVWYSAPSILSLLAQYGGLERAGFAAPRLVLFAGEVFPIRHLRRLRSLWPAATMWNLYGPTETNVCTALAIPSTIDPEQTEPFPIGRVCPPLRARVLDEGGVEPPAGGPGELLIAGPGVMTGYFGRPDLDAAAFLLDGDGTRWYRTGDLVADDGTGCFRFHGRRDRLVKKRGYRIELGEIESALDRHEDVERVAVVAQPEDAGVAITAFVTMKPGRKASIIAMKRHCTSYLPHYMVPDTIAFLPELPTTSTDKVDYQGLRRLLRSTGTERP